MNGKRAFLLAKAKVFEMQELNSCYDEKEQLNLQISGGQSLPLVMDEGFARTESKTFQAPSDDDPDPEAEGCY